MSLKLVLKYGDIVGGSRIDLVTYALKESVLVHLAIEVPNILCNWPLYKLPYNKKHQIKRVFHLHLLATNTAYLLELVLLVHYEQ